jgi:type IV fimbrial biogenesis protein FimT
MTYQRGMTFLELMLAVAIGAILVGIGAPSFVTTIRNSEMTSSTNGLVGALHAARSEAVKRRSRVTLCRADITGAVPACSGSGMGLAVFLNVNNDASLDTGAGDVVIQSVPWLRDTIEVYAPGMPAAISFTASGFTRAVDGSAISGDLLFCGPRGDEGARLLTVSPTGRPLVRRQNEVSGAPTCP